jgi:hypothetical protein
MASSGCNRFVEVACRRVGAGCAEALRVQVARFYLYIIRRFGVFVKAMSPDFAAAPAQGIVCMSDKTLPKFSCATKVRAVFRVESLAIHTRKAGIGSAFPAVPDRHDR